MVDKSKIPDISEITNMAGKLFKDVKQSVTEIVGDYKKNHGSKAAKSVNPTESSTATVEADSQVENKSTTDSADTSKAPESEKE